ncbi:hypothetical protein P7C70_g2906, partial [Phenoliferia sp. Uapishka_3]
MSATSYSALIRRSKLASYQTSIDQVYSSYGAHLSRSNFGLKRPLPKASTSAAPYVRINRLDSVQKRTEFRKATREVLFVKKLEEAGTKIRGVDSARSDVDSLKEGHLQSRFIAPGQDGSIGSSLVAQALRPPNFLAMQDDEFAAFLDTLDSRRDEFAKHVQHRNSNNKTINSGPVDLSLLATSSRSPELISHVESFLALSHSP